MFARYIEIVCNIDTLFISSSHAVVFACSMRVSRAQEHRDFVLLFFSFAVYFRLGQFHQETGNGDCLSRFLHAWCHSCCPPCQSADEKTEHREKQPSPHHFCTVCDGSDALQKAQVYIYCDFSSIKWSVFFVGNRYWHNVIVFHCL